MSDEEFSEYEHFCQKNIQERKTFMENFLLDMKNDAKEIEELEKSRQELIKKNKKSSKRQSLIVFKEHNTRNKRRRHNNDDILGSTTIIHKFYNSDNSDGNGKKVTDLLTKIEEKRIKTADSIFNFQFNENRVKVLSSIDETAPNSKGIVYWMFQDARVQDNWALLFAQKIALIEKLPLHVCFCLAPEYLDTSLLYYDFLLEGLKEVEKDLQKLNINFHLFFGDPATELVNIVKKYRMGALICDFLPLKLHLSWIEEICKKLPETCPFMQVDAYNVVPCWENSENLDLDLDLSTRSRTEILDEYLTEYPPVIMHPYSSTSRMEKNKWEAASKLVKTDRTKKTVNLIAGYTSGINELEKFINNDLESYSIKRYNNLNPYYNCGMISVQRGILEINEFYDLYCKSVNDYLEDILVNYVHYDNFCFYNSSYNPMQKKTM